MILDCHFGPLPDPVALDALAARLDGRAGVAGHGLFLGLASEVFVAGAEGVRRLTPPVDHPFPGRPLRFRATGRLDLGGGPGAP
jgi:ribose 5-phosphate isomerase A